jgi:very-short-patch-repair endonuclease
MRNALAQRRATELRRQLTDTETALWHRLRRRQINGLHFRRQVPIGSYIADFACAEIKLIIEVDGSQHANSSHDAARDAYLRKQGYRILRFWSHDVLLSTDSVVQSIYEATKMPPP